MTNPTIEQLVNKASKNDDKLCDHNGFSHEISCFEAGASFAAPLYREEGFMESINYLKAHGYWFAHNELLTNKDKILGFKK